MPAGGQSGAGLLRRGGEAITPNRAGRHVKSRGRSRRRRPLAHLAGGPAPATRRSRHRVSQRQPPASLHGGGGQGAARRAARPPHQEPLPARSEEHTSELQSLMRISYAVFCLKKKKKKNKQQ